MNQRHTCEWTPTQTGYACTQCDATSPACINTDTRRKEHPTGTSRLICDTCANTENYVLDDIHDALTHWDERDAHRQKSPMAFDLVQAPTNNTNNTPSTPNDIKAELTAWAIRWSAHTGGSNGETTNDYLKSRIQWAAHNPTQSRWNEYRTHVRQLRHTARRITGLTPDRHPEACMHCDGRIIQDRADHKWQPLEHGLSDTIRCQTCGLTWNDRTHLQRNIRHHIWALPNDHPDKLVTIDQAAEIFPDIPRPTIRWWLHQDRKQDIRELPEREHLRDGTPLYRLGDLHSKATQRTKAGREGRPAQPTGGKITA